MNPTRIDAYAAGAPLLAKAIAGLSAEDFLATPVPNTWSIAQITIHLMDADLIGADRMKRIIAEDNPPLIGYNQAAFAQKLFYEKLDPFLAAEIFQKNRDMTSVILRNLPEAAFARVGTHNERGRMTLADLVQGYTDHLEHHLKFIRHKRQLLGKPL
jgi:uncharacterized damage-inducible protein DinB